MWVETDCTYMTLVLYTTFCIHPLVHYWRVAAIYGANPSIRSNSGSSILPQHTHQHEKLEEPGIKPPIFQLEACSTFRATAAPIGWTSNFAWAIPLRQKLDTYVYTHANIHTLEALCVFSHSVSSDWEAASHQQWHLCLVCVCVCCVWACDRSTCVTHYLYVSDFGWNEACHA